MDRLRELAERVCREGTLLQATLSGPRRKAPDEPSKVKVKPVLLKGERQYQFIRTIGPKVFHENVSPDAAAAMLVELMGSQFKQGLVQTGESDYQVFVDKKGSASILAKSATKQQVELEHNRKKKYVLEEGTPVPFLVELGVMNAQGKVLAPKYDKFRQINRFLEMIEDVTPYLPDGRTVRILDFGCGKSYLTFALYHYLVHLRKLPVEIVGLDLKSDVIAHCSGLAEQFGYEGLRFLVGDISEYKGMDQVDMVVTLHACDTATDAALEKAVRWGAGVILSVPCCQHELNRQVRNETLSPMLNHGIIKERFSSLATDSVRAHLLELAGYKTQILEFIDMEHTPKNLLIRAVRQPPEKGDKEKAERLAQSYLEFKRFLHIDPYLERALSDKLAPLFAAAEVHRAQAD